MVIIDACFVCSTVSSGSLPAMQTICMPSGKSIAEQLCKGLGCSLLPLMPEHVACISCQQTVSHLDQIWAEADILQRALADRFLKSFHQMEFNTMTPDKVVSSEVVISPPISHLSSLSEAINGISSMSAAPVTGGSCYAQEDTSHASSSGSPSYTTMEPPHRPQLHAAQSPQPEMDTPVENSYCPVGDVIECETQSPENTLASVSETTDLNPEENTTDPAPDESQEPISTPAPQTSSQAPRTGPKTCPHCGRTYQRWRDLDTHLSVHTGSLPHQCAECGRQFASRRRLTDHQRGHAEGWRCQICDKVFHHPSSLQHHRRQHEPTSPDPVCPVCSRTLSSAAQLRAHLRTHTDERPYQCNFCPRAFRQASTLRVHARLHSGERPFQCDTCGKGFRGRAAFMTHLQQHGAVAARFACDTCGKTFFYKSKMEQHRATHGDRQAACCEQCGVTFGSVAALKRHQVTHSSQRPHVCPVCGRRFKEAGVLKKHQRQMHAADAGHVCSVCGKRCAGPFKLSEHMRTHTGERPFACSLCPKSFTQAVHLSTHQRTHQRTEATAELGNL